MEDFKQHLSFFKQLHPISEFLLCKLSQTNQNPNSKLACKSLVKFYNGKLRLFLNSINVHTLVPLSLPLIMPQYRPSAARRRVCNNEWDMIPLVISYSKRSKLEIAALPKFY